MAYATHLRPESIAPSAPSREASKVAPELAVEALRIAARALDPRPRQDRREQTLDVIRSRLTAILQSVAVQLDAVESIRAHLRLLESIDEAETQERRAALPPHWRSRGPRPRRFSEDA